MVTRRFPTRQNSRDFLGTPSLPVCLARRPNRIIFGSCSSQKESQACWSTIIAQQPDLVALLGDNVYERESSSIKQAYEDLNKSSSFQSLAKAIPIIATLDDNDYTSNYEAGKSAFLDFFHVPSTDPRRRSGRGMHSCYEWHDGSLQIILLDVRYHATPASILGEDQWSWLLDCLQRPCQLRIIGSPTQILATGHPWECWANVSDQRDRFKLLNSCFSSAQSTIFVSGDRHVGALYETSDGFRELTTSSLTHSVSPKGALDGEMDTSRIGGYVYENNFGQMDIDWENKVVRVSLCGVADGCRIVQNKWAF